MDWACNARWLATLGVILGLSCMASWGCDTASGDGGDDLMGDLSDGVDAASDLVAEDASQDAVGVPRCEDGAERGAGDGCNRCTCVGGVWSCTQQVCGPAGVCPAPQLSGEVCDTSTVVYALDPESNACCRYATACEAPTDWHQFHSRQECEAACTVGATRLADDGCNTCVCTEERGWACTLHVCPADNSCETAADCMVTGCSGEVCAAQPVETSCMEPSAAGCFGSATTCDCIEGACAWAPTAELGACLDAELWCRPGHVRRASDGCNLCWCTADGRWKCGEKDCRVCPGEAKDAQPCEARQVWARDPVGGLCCRYASPCGAPRGWAQYESEQECHDSGCEPGSERPAADGCNECVCDESRAWRCTQEPCATQSCERDEDCFATGCNGELCAAEHLYTSCDWDAKVACYSEPFTRCGCQSGRCGWAMGNPLELCLNAVGR